MATFRDQLHAFTAKLGHLEQAVFQGVILEAQRSIVDGSELTGAPGQPVDTGTLKGSWQSWLEGDDTAIIATDVTYAPYIEDGGNSRGAFTLRSAVGGFHSVSLTTSNIDRIVAAVTERVAETGMALPAITAQTGYTGEDGG